MDTKPRELRDGERAVLQLIQDVYGDQNQPEAVIFHGKDAVLFVRDVHGVMGLCANLSFLADLLADGASLDAIRDDYLTPHAD